MTQETTARSDDWFNPFTYGLGLWSKLADGRMKMLETLHTSFLDLEADGYQRAQKLSRDMGAMVQASLTSAVELSAAWQKSVLEAARKGSELFTGK